ncbi:PepSY-like domain-containing protein [Christiangramia sp.]|uniref:PepSY-like domain-containing protein n=1 Tax=Christiangramia sp. TaxID=1931228 RepID=UPI002639DDE7|nr:PepSY-like domain-containing protein [Christiangramia sp.]
MKNLTTLTLTVCGLLLLSACSSEEENNTEENLNAIAFTADAHVRTSTLPQSILEFITNNYPGLTIIEAEVEDNNNFEITLSGNTELIFDSQGNFLGEDRDDEDDFGDEDLEVSELPENILDFIDEHFPGVGIDEAERESNGHYEIELDNDIELIFDVNGNFLGIAHDENEDEQDEMDIHPDDLPQAIKDYISANYPEETIIEAEIEEDGTYEVTLNNGIELEFDEDGNFLSAEDGNGDDDDDDDEND